jgi:hypothetical protein
MAGLNGAQREVIRGMVMGGESDKAVRSMISRFVYIDGSQCSSSSVDGSTMKNMQFCRELATNGYTEAAKLLSDRIS